MKRSLLLPVLGIITLLSGCTNKKIELQETHWPGGNIEIRTEGYYEEIEEEEEVFIPHGKKEG